MYNKTEIINSIDIYIEKNKLTISADSLAFLTEIKDKIKKANNENKLSKWAYELLRFINLFRDFFDT
jgi:hypothetical protein